MVRYSLRGGREQIRKIFYIKLKTGSQRTYAQGITTPFATPTLVRYIADGTDFPVQCVSQGDSCAVDKAYCSIELPTK